MKKVGSINVNKCLKRRQLFNTGPQLIVIDNKLKNPMRTGHLVWYGVRAQLLSLHGVTANRPR